MSSSSDRRTFLKQTTAASALLPVLPGGLVLPVRRKPRRDTLRIALVGCGGRGTGAAVQAMRTDGATELVAMADAFEDRIERSLQGIASELEGVTVPADRRFVGFDAYRKAIDTDCDVVILATPPGFRPEHFRYAVEKGRHVFMEKPVAVDAPGVRQVLESARASMDKGLKVGVGLQRHHEARYLATVRRLREGAIGDVVAQRVYWNMGSLWMKERLPEMTEMEYQMRNWYYFTWLCGDHIVEQHIHNLDVANWVKGAHPVKAQGQGGRQVRTGKEYGQIFDHHFVEYTYPDGSKLFSQCRQIDGCFNSVSEHAHGTRGHADTSAGRITSGSSEWAFDDENPNPYQVEHDDLFRAIREDEAYNEAGNGAIATMTAILGRMATYSGREITWEEGLASEENLLPPTFAWDATPPIVPDAEGWYPVPKPGLA